MPITATAADKNHFVMISLPLISRKKKTPHNPLCHEREKPNLKIGLEQALSFVGMMVSIDVPDKELHLTKAETRSLSKLRC